MNSRFELFCIVAFFIVASFVRPGILWSQDDVKASGSGLTAELDRDAAGVGSTVALTLRYQIPEGSRLPEEPKISGLDGFTIIERVVEPGQIRIKLLVDRLEPYQSGPIGLTYLDKEGKGQIVEADPVTLQVLSNLGDKPEEAQLRPIQDILPTRAVWLKYGPWAAVLLLLLLTVFGFFWWRKKNRARADILQLEDPPHIRALTLIENLEAQRLYEKGKVKEFYFLFTAILRQYLESLRGFPAAEFTTEEIAGHMDNDRDRMLLPLLREADLVKFADTIPTRARKDEDVETAVSYIRETSPASVEAQK